MQAASVDGMFRAFADETRLRILRLLTQGEICVCDLMRVLGAPQPKVSRHLGYLKRAGLVADRKEGPWRHYVLAPATTALQRSLLGCLDACFREVPVLRRDAESLRLLRKRKAKGCR